LPFLDFIGFYQVLTHEATAMLWTRQFCLPSACSRVVHSDKSSNKRNSKQYCLYKTVQGQYKNNAF